MSGYSLWSIQKRIFVQQKTTVLVSMLSILLASTFVFVLVGCYLGVAHILWKSTGDMNEQRLEVLPKFRVGFLRVTKTNDTPITDATVEKIKNIPHVTSVERERISTIPSSLLVNIFGAEFQTDSPIYGLEDGYFSTMTQASSSSKNIPLLVSKDLLNVYNLGIAEAVRKPALDEQALMHFPVNLLFGVSSFASESRQKTLPAEVVGVSEGVSLVGVSMPLSTLVNIERELGKEEKSPTYARLVVNVDSSLERKGIQEQVQKLGFDVHSSEDAQLQMQGKLDLLLRVVVGMSGFVVLLLLLQFFFLFTVHFEKNHFLMALMKFYGMRVGRVLNFYLFQFLWFVLPGIFGGVFFSYGILVTLSNVVHASYPSLVSASRIFLLEFWQYFLVASVLFFPLALLYLISLLPLLKKHIISIFSQQ